MLKTFPIDFIRQILEQKLYQEHIKDTNFFGGRNQVNILSFYEQLKSQDEVDRFVETYRDLADQQNRSGLILNGVLLSPENPSITNLYSSLIIPMAYTCSLRCMLENRDQAIATINNLIDKLKGHKVDIAQLDCIDENGNKYTTPFMVGTIGNNDGAPKLQTGDYIGKLTSTSDIYDKLSYYMNNGILDSVEDFDYLYCENDNKIKVIKHTETYSEDIIETPIDNTETISSDYKTITIKCLSNGHKYISEYNDIVGQITIHDMEESEDAELDLEDGIVTNIEYTQYQQTIVTIQFKTNVAINNLVNQYTGFEFNFVNAYSYIWAFVEDDGTLTNILFPPTHTSFEKYKVSMSFDAIRCDEPRNLNGKEYCELSFGGSVTLASDGIAFGNDLVKLFIKKLQIQAETNIDLSSDTGAWLEPLEMPSGSNANTQINQLVSNNFISNSHTDTLALTLQYTFVLDKNIKLLNQWFKYARYGLQKTNVNGISPNIEYGVKELWCSWGDLEIFAIRTKIVENIDIENTEGDTLTLTMSMQIQGEWE